MDDVLPFFVTLDPVALNTFGLTDGATIDGVAVVTFGFLWPADSIWFTCGDDPQTTWTECT